MEEPRLPPLLPALREDLHIFEAGRHDDGSPLWRLHDPLRNRFYQIGWREFLMLSHWREVAPQDFAAGVQQAAPIEIEEGDIVELLRFLDAHQLLQRHGRAQCLSATASAQRRDGKLKWLLHNYLFLRIRLANPDRFYQALLPALGFFFTRKFWLLAGFAALAAAFGLTQQWESFTHTFSYVFSLEGMLWVAVALVLSKLAHELGHGLAAKYLGLRVTGVGVAFLVLWPVLFTDVGEIWKLSDRRQRFMISAAGIAAEGLLALLALLAWLALPDGPLRSALFVQASTVLIITLAINLNPFIRFDGYFLLSDALNFPNLHERAFGSAKGWLRGRLGFPDTGCDKGWLTLFGLATWIYRLVLFTGIAVLVYYAFPKVLGAFLALVEIGWFILLPVWREMHAWWQMRSELAQKYRRRLAWYLLAVLAVLLFPWRGHITAPALFSPSEIQYVYAPASARIQEMGVTNGTGTKNGHLLLTLSSPDLEVQSAKNQARIIQARQELLALARGGDQERDKLNILTERLAERHVAQEAIQSELERLKLFSSLNGTVRDWDNQLVPGTWVRKNSLLGKVTGERGARVVAFVSEADYGRIARGAEVRFYPNGTALSVLAGKIMEIAANPTDALDYPALSSANGGPLAVTTTPEGQWRLHEARYRIEAAIEYPHFASTDQEWMGTLRIESGSHGLLADILGWIAHDVVKELYW